MKSKRVVVLGARRSCAADLPGRCDPAPIYDEKIKYRRLSRASWAP
jgi:hypothetical protein